MGRARTSTGGVSPAHFATHAPSTRRETCFTDLCRPVSLRPDGLWLGQRAPSAGSKPIVAGDLGWDPLGLKPKDPAAYKIMQLKELKNGRYERRARP